MKPGTIVEEVPACVWREQVADGAPQRIKSSSRSLAQQRLEFGEHLLNRVQIRTLSRADRLVLSGYAQAA